MGREGRGRRTVVGRRGSLLKKSWRAGWSASAAGPEPGRRGLHQEEGRLGGLLEGSVGLPAHH